MRLILKYIRPAVSLALAGLLLFTTVFGQASVDNQAAKMKAEIQKLGTGKNARIKLQLRDGSRVSGYVSEIRDKTFVLISDASGAPTEIEYVDAKHPPRTFPRSLQYLVVAGVVVGILAIAGWLGRGE